MQDYTNSNIQTALASSPYFQTRLGWKIGEVTVTLKKGKKKADIKQQLEKAFNKKVTNQNIWLKEKR